jgi:hypothetical protein
VASDQTGATYERSSVWLERGIWDAEVAGSSPVAYTISPAMSRRRWWRAGSDTSERYSIETAARGGYFRKGWQGRVGIGGALLLAGVSKGCSSVGSRALARVRGRGFDFRHPKSGRCLHMRSSRGVYRWSGVYVNHITVDNSISV